jgi:hypothetical protein
VHGCAEEEELPLPSQAETHERTLASSNKQWAVLNPVPQVYFLPKEKQEVNCTSISNCSSTAQGSRVPPLLVVVITLAIAEEGLKVLR